MKEFLKKTINFILVLSLAVIFSLALKTMVYADDLKVIGSDLGLKVTPENTKLFDVGVMNPGQTVTNKISISNNYGAPFQLFLRNERLSESPLPDAPDLYKQLQLKVTLRDEVIYSGPMLRFAGREDSLSLGSFDPEEKEELTASVYLPGLETGNEFQGQSLNTRWIFTAVSEDVIDIPDEPVPGGGIDLPKTGYFNNTFLYTVSGVLLISAGVYGLYIYSRGKKRKNKITERKLK